MALFGKKKGLVGVDIGSSAIKVVELKPGGKGGNEYQLANLGLEPLPPEAIVFNPPHWHVAIETRADGAYHVAPRPKTPARISAAHKETVGPKEA